MEYPTEEDMSWPARFREAEANYAQFYTQPTSGVSVMRLYASADGELESVGRSHTDLVEPGALSGEELSEAVAKGASVGGVHYRLAAAGVFTVALGPESIETFVSTEWEPSAWSSIDVDAPGPIRLADTVHALGKETTLVLLYRRKASRARRQTARREPLHLRRPPTRTTRRSRKGLKAVAVKHHT